MTRTHVVTGGTKGIGEALVRKLAADGNHVIFTGRSQSRGSLLAEELSRKNFSATFCRQDVSKPSDWLHLRDAIERSGGNLHGLVNNAGIHSMKTVDQYTETDFRQLVDINLLGVFFGVQTCLPYLEVSGTEAEPASIVNLSSVAGLVGGVGQSLYNMTKGGVELFTKSIALETAALGHHIKVNTVCPGIVETEMGEDLIRQFAETGLAKSIEHADRTLRRGYSHGKFPTVSDVVETISFLLEAKTPFLTGASIPVDRGYTTG